MIARIRYGAPHVSAAVARRPKPKPVSTPGYWLRALALQVQEPGSDVWGNVNTREYKPNITSDREKMILTEELKSLKYRWINSGHFSAGCKYQIVTIETFLPMTPKQSGTVH